MKWQTLPGWFRTCWSCRSEMLSIIFRKAQSFNFAVAPNVTSASSMVQKPYRHAPEKSFLFLHSPQSYTPPPIIYLFLFCMCHCLCTHLTYFYSSHLKKNILSSLAFLSVVIHFTLFCLLQYVTSPYIVNYVVCANVHPLIVSMQ